MVLCCVQTLISGCVFLKAQPKSPLKVLWRCFSNKILYACVVELESNKHAPNRPECGEPTESALSSEISLSLCVFPQVPTSLHVLLRVFFFFWKETSHMEILQCRRQTEHDFFLQNFLFLTLEVSGGAWSCINKPAIHLRQLKSDHSAVSTVTCVSWLESDKIK